MSPTGFANCRLWLTTTMLAGKRPLPGGSGRRGYHMMRDAHLKHSEKVMLFKPTSPQDWEQRLIPV